MRIYSIKDLGEQIFSKGNGTNADISVIVPLYNYAWSLEWCLNSVYKQNIKDISVVVIDDCSTDSGLDVAVKWATANWSRFSNFTIIRHLRNHGVSMERNSGIIWSKEPLLFMLDADNELRTGALMRLKEALEVSRSEFAYSHLWRIGDVNLIGFANIWDPSLLAEGNYLDTMALIRREALLAAKGYAVVGDDSGLEDYDLWCRFAELGFSGVFLPEVLCDYRVHGRSRNTLAHQTITEARHLLVEMALRHPTIVKI